MAKQVQFRGGTTAQHSVFTGADREITVDTDKDTLVVHDGSIVGGFPLARESVVNTALNTKVDKNANITASTGTKITYDEKGLVTSSTTPTTLAGYSIGDAYTKTEIDTIIGSGLTTAEYDIRYLNDTLFTIPDLSDIIYIKCNTSYNFQQVTLPTTGAVLNQLVKITAIGGTTGPYRLSVTTSGTININHNQSTTVRFNGSYWVRQETSMEIRDYENYMHNNDTALSLNKIANGYTQTITSSQTVYPPHSGGKYSYVEVTCIGGGGGGGSGRKGAAGTARSGGGGGSAGGVSKAIITASELTIAIGAGGTGGANVTTNSTSGNSGTDGGKTTVYSGTFLRVQSAGGKSGNGGTTSNAIAAVGTYYYDNGTRSGTAFGLGGVTSVTSTPADAGTSYEFRPAGGGGGGSISTANVAYSGGKGGSIANYSSGSTNEVIATGGAGGIPDGTLPQPAVGYELGAGSGGGAASITTNAQAGLGGFIYGMGAGGGGAAVDAVGNSGAGGDGGPGLVILRWF